jgi:hypothetical protein
MYSFAYIEGKLKGHKREKLGYHIANVAGFALLIVMAMVIAPLLHESLHMLFLEMNNVDYSMEINFNWENGVYGRLKPLSELSISNSVIMLGMGIFGNLLLSSVLFFGSWRIKESGRLPESIFSTYLAVGFFYSPFIYFFAPGGDLINILALLDLGGFSYALPLIGCILFIFASIHVYRHAKHAFLEYDTIGEEIEKLENFLLFRLTPENQTC